MKKILKSCSSLEKDQSTHDLEVWCFERCSPRKVSITIHCVAKKETVMTTVASVLPSTTCTRCGTLLISPDWSENEDGRAICIWSCPVCGHEFQTTENVVGPKLSDTELAEEFFPNLLVGWFGRKRRLVNRGSNRPAPFGCHCRPRNKISSGELPHTQTLDGGFIFYRWWSGGAHVDRLRRKHRHREEVCSSSSRNP